MVTNVMFLTMRAKPRQLPAGEFKAKCLAFLDEIEQPLSRVLARMQLAGFKVDVPVLRGLGQKIGED